MRISKMFKNKGVNLTRVVPFVMCLTVKLYLDISQDQY